MPPHRPASLACLWVTVRRPAGTTRLRCWYWKPEDGASDPVSFPASLVVEEKPDFEPSRRIPLLVKDDRALVFLDPVFVCLGVRFVRMGHRHLGLACLLQPSAPSDFYAEQYRPFLGLRLGLHHPPSVLACPSLSLFAGVVVQGSRQTGDAFLSVVSHPPFLDRPDVPSVRCPMPFPTHESCPSCPLVVLLLLPLLPLAPSFACAAAPL